jgi:hypothetical protein
MRKAGLSLSLSATLKKNRRDKEIMTIYKRYQVRVDGEKLYVDGHVVAYVSDGRWMPYQDKAHILMDLDEQELLPDVP